MRHNKAAAALARVFLNVVLSLFAILAVFPLVWMVYSSVKSEPEFARDIIGLPREIHIENYRNAIVIGRMGTYSLNSLYVTVGSVLLIASFAFMLGYFLNRFKFRGRGFFYGLFLVGLMIPIHGFLVPLYIQFSRLQISDKWFTLFFPETAFALPLAVILIENFLRSVPMEIEEAAIIDGAGLMPRIAWIIAPVCRPIMATVLILNFLWTWNEFPFALTLLSSRNLRTLPLGLSNFRGEHNVQFVYLFAAITLVSIPVLLVYSAFSRRIMQGMTAGAVKG